MQADDGDEEVPRHARVPGAAAVRDPGPRPGHGGAAARVQEGEHVEHDAAHEVTHRTRAATDPLVTTIAEKAFSVKTDGSFAALLCIGMCCREMAGRMAEMQEAMDRECPTACEEDSVQTELSFTLMAEQEPSPIIDIDIHNI